jgi:hypothetical protein
VFGYIDSDSYQSEVKSELEEQHLDITFTKETQKKIEESEKHKKEAVKKST